MVRPESCTVPAGGSPVRVIAGAPGSRHQSAGEILQTERCVKSLEAGGSKGAGRNKVNASASSHNQPKGVREGEPLMSRRRPRTAPRLRNVRWASPGYGRRHATKGECGTGETLPGGPRRVKTSRIRREPKSRGAGRESEGFVVPVKAARNRRREGTLPRSRLRWG